MDRIVKSLILLMIMLMEVSLLLATYVLGVVYLTYMSIRGKREFKKTFKELSKDLIDDLKNVLNEQKDFMVKA